MVRFQKVQAVYAVIRTGSKQYRVRVGEELLVEKLPGEAGQSIEIADVLLYSTGDGQVEVGKPVLPIVAVCTVVGDEKGDKLRTIKYRRRHNYKRTYGHRQQYTRLVVEKFERKGN